MAKTDKQIQEEVGLWTSVVLFVRGLFWSGKKKEKRDEEQ